MEGGIYAEDKCPVCGKTFYHDPNRGYVCRKHKAVSTRLRVQFRGIRKRFNNYEDASNFLSGVRFKADEGSFDKRDYASDNPLGFANYVDKYLLTKKKLNSYRDIETHLKKAIAYFDQTNIKNIEFPGLDDFLLTLGHLSEKTQHNHMADLHAFFVWACRREKKQLTMPDFPKVDYKMGWRNTIRPDQQQDILDEIERATYSINPKIWFGVKCLMTYISIRPNELRNIKEGDFDLNLGTVFIRDPKDKKSKTVPLRPEDIEFVKSFPTALPHLYFFRHPKGISGCTAGSQFGDKYLYKVWKKACAVFGINDVDLYGGTRHSTARAMRMIHSPEQIKRATMHTTNKAFERYFQIELEDIRDLYDMGTIRGQHKSPSKSYKVLKLKH